MCCCQPVLVCTPYQRLGPETVSEDLLAKIPPAILNDIKLNYQDPGVPVTFRNILYRLLAIRRDQHVSAVLSSSSADDMLELHSFLFEVRTSNAVLLKLDPPLNELRCMSSQLLQNYPQYAETCCLATVPVPEDASKMTLPVCAAFALCLLMLCSTLPRCKF